MIVNKWTERTFTPSLALGQILQIVASLLVFVLADHVYANVHDYRQKRVGILVDMASTVLAQVDRVHSAFLKCQGRNPIPRKLRFELDGAFTDYGNALFELEQVLPDTVHSNVGPSFEDLKENRRAYKDLVTGAPYPIHSSSDRIVVESNCYTTARSNIRKFQIQLV